jgi:hypothetical protein
MVSDMPGDKLRPVVSLWMTQESNYPFSNYNKSEPDFCPGGNREMPKAFGTILGRTAGAAGAP